MKKLPRLIFSLTLLILAIGLALSAPASARQDRGGDRNNDSSTAQIADNDSSTNDTPADAADPQKSSLLAEQFKEQAREKSQQAKDDHRAKTEAEREKACSVRKTVLTQRMAKSVAQAKKHKVVFDKIYARVKDFYAAKNLSVSNYADLTARVDATSSDAQANIDALSALNVTVDCTSETVGTSIDAFQAAVKSSRDSLKTYRASIVSLITAVKGAATGAADSSTNSANQ